MTLAANPAQNWNASFTFVGSNPLNLGTGAVTLGVTPTATVSGSTLTVGGNISGNFGLSLKGAGMLNLGGSNSYTGTTTINSGVLQLGAASAIPTGAGAGNLVFSKRHGLGRVGPQWQQRHRQRPLAAQLRPRRTWS